MTLMPLTAHRLQPSVHSSPFTVHFIPFTVHRSRFTAPCSLFTMCGIAGIFAYHYAATAGRSRRAAHHPRPHGRARPGWHGRVVFAGQPRRPRAPAAVDHRPLRPRRPAHGQHRRPAGHQLQRRDLQLPRTEEGPAKPAAASSAPSPTPRSCCSSTPKKAEAMLHDLRGMFAFALWDARKQALLLARDPYGIKPLYYADDGWTCRFASQVKALLTSPKVSRLPEPAGLAGFYLFGSVPEPYTLYQEVRSVPAGSYQWVDATGPHVPVQYFSLPQIWAEAEQSPPLSQSALQEAVREAVRDSVRHHMVADVPVGAFLSAGIDSGALVGLMSEMSGTNWPLAGAAPPPRQVQRFKPSPWPSKNSATPTPTRLPSQRRSPATTASATASASSMSRNSVKTYRRSFRPWISPASTASTPGSSARPPAKPASRWPSPAWEAMNSSAAIPHSATSPTGCACSGCQAISPALGS